MAGGAGYLGLPVCDGFLEQGGSLAIADYDEDALEEAVSHLQSQYGNEKVYGIEFDIADEDSVDEAVTEAVDRFGKLDVLVNATFTNAGKTFDELSADEFDGANRVNVTGSFLLARRAAEEMEGGGSIIMYASMYGIESPNPDTYPPRLEPNPVEYGAGKAAVIQMVKYLAAHYGKQNIRVNAVAPGAFPNPKIQKDSPEFISRLCDKAMLGRIGKRDETAGAVVFLASDEASFVTGEVLCVDGGITAW